MTSQAHEASGYQSARASYGAFALSIERLCRADPGARAALRVGLRRDLDHPRARPMHRVLTSRLPEMCDDRTAQAHYTVAALIAAQPRHTFALDSEDEAVSAEQGRLLLQESGEAGGTVVSSESIRYGQSFGATLGQAVIAKGASMRMSAAESRITLLTRQSLRGLHLHLPAAVNQVRVTDAPIDWGQLLMDLVNWPYQSGRISRRWLQDFYRITARVDRD